MSLAGSEMRRGDRNRDGNGARRRPRESAGARRERARASRQRYRPRLSRERYERAAGGGPRALRPVSSPPLTLPTKRQVYLPVVGRPLRKWPPPRLPLNA
ncbi:hypothetical protein CF645_38655 [Burkholderia pseudomallei]|nr:hypothetical protein CF645_38655 [Burkholderia pseudomallei]